MYKKIHLAIESGLFNPGLIEVVAPPNREQIIRRAEELSFALHPDHVQLLLEWGGSNLDEIRINELNRVVCDGTFVEFANDYNGFIFKYDHFGAVYSEDTDGGQVREVALSIPEFINEVLLGEQCVPFYGEDWLEELRNHELV